jgi:hypothetical protein
MILATVNNPAVAAFVLIISPTKTLAVLLTVTSAVVPGAFKNPTSVVVARLAAVRALIPTFGAPPKFPTAGVLIVTVRGERRVTVARPLTKATRSAPPVNVAPERVAVKVAAAFAVGALNEATRENNIVTVRIILRIFFIIMFRLLSSE